MKKARKKRYLWIWAAVALLCLLGVLAEIFKKELYILIRGSERGAWYGIHEWMNPTPKRVRQAAENLAASEDAKKLAFAAILGQRLEERFGLNGKYARPFNSAPEIKSEHAMPQETLDNWRKAALGKVAADDVQTLFMLATFVPFKSDTAKAVRKEAFLRWQQAEPDNLATLLYQETLPVDELLEQAQTRSQFVDYNYPISRWMYQTLLQQLANKPKSVVTEIMLIEGLSGFPSIFKITETCKKNPPERNSVKWQQCKSIAQKMREQSSNTILRVAGISILKNLSDDKEKNIFDNEREHIMWLHDQRKKLVKGVQAFERFKQRLEDESINSEQQDMEDLLRKKGLPLKATDITPNEGDK